MKRGPGNMKGVFSKYIRKMFSRGWVIGITRGNIKDIIRTKSFNPDIKWIPVEYKKEFHADPFLLKSNDGGYEILYEDYSWVDGYGRIGVMSLDKSLHATNKKIVLDTKSHLSYPFFFQENGKTYVFPEAGRSGKLSCYEYENGKKTLKFIQEILNVPLLDGTILKHSGKYWLFGIIRNRQSDQEYQMHVYFADTLLGPYTAHPGNPLKNAMNGTRSAGNFIEVDGVIYRPTQNCENIYGESITLNRLTVLNEKEIAEEPYMDITIDKRKRKNAHIQTIHTINFADDVIVVDGIKERFSPMNIVKALAKRKDTYYQQLKRNKFFAQAVIIQAIFLASQPVS